MAGGFVHSTATFVRSRAGHFFFVFGYLWLLLSVYALHNSIVLADWRLLGHLLPALIKALVLAKFLLIGEHLGLEQNLEDKPMILPILLNAAIFSLLLIGLDYLEVLFRNWLRPPAGADVGSFEPKDLRTITAYAVMCFVALIPFFAFQELSKLLGPERMSFLMFRRRKKIVLPPMALPI